MSTLDLTFPAARLPMPTVWRFASTGLIAAFAVYLVSPLAATELAARGHTAAEIGFFYLLAPLTMIGLILTLPGFQRRIGRLRAVKLGLGAALAALAGFALTENFALWCLFSILVGVQFAIHWTSVDTVLSENVPKERAGAIIGLYQTLLAGTIAAGPAAAGFSELDFQTAAWIGAGLLAASYLLTLGGGLETIDASAAVPSQAGLLSFLVRNAPLFALALLAGLFEVGTTAMTQLHAMHLGFAAGAAVLFASVIAFGSLAAQTPLGWLADRLSVPLMMRFCGLILAASAAALPLAAAEPRLLWVLAALWGAFGGGLQTLVYMHIAVSKQGAEIGLGMILMALGFTIGTLIGPGLGGLAMDIWAEHGLALMLAVMAAGVTLLSIRRLG